MCGIAGSLQLQGGSADRHRLQRMIAAIQHRGPDDEGATDPTVVLGYVITDADGSPTANNTLTIRGDAAGAYNLRRDLEPVLDRLMAELRPELEQLGALRPEGRAAPQLTPTPHRRWRRTPCGAAGARLAVVDCESVATRRCRQQIRSQLSSGSAGGARRGGCVGDCCFRGPTP